MALLFACSAVLQGGSNQAAEPLPRWVWVLIVGGACALIAIIAAIVGKRSVRADIKRVELEPLDWSSSTAALMSLEKLKNYALALAWEAVSWYGKAKKNDKVFALSVRVLVVVLSAIAGILPIVSEWTRTDGFQVSPLWSTLALALAATVFSLDRYFGFSKAWIRYVQAQTRIETLTTTFRLNWESELACLTPTPPCEKHQALIAIAAKFVGDLRKVIEEETGAWVDDFRQSTSELETQLQHQAEQDAKKAKEREEREKSEAAAAKPGFLKVVLTNSPGASAEWKLYIDGKLYVDDVAPGPRKGSTALARVPAGMRMVRVEHDGPPATRAADAIRVEPDDKVELKLTLT